MKKDEENMKSIWDEFTGKYSLQKTLRFELKPVGADGQILPAEKASEIFQDILAEDRKIKEAYVALKPVMDKIHENVINGALTSDDALNIDFNKYYKEYDKGKDRKLEAFENALRTGIGETFRKKANALAKSGNERYAEIHKDDNKKAKKKEKNSESEDAAETTVFKKKNGNDVGINYLTQAGILKYIEMEIKNLVPEERVSEFIETKTITDEKGKNKIVRSGYLETFTGFFTYFSGYNQNRENYYVYEKEASTAVATRIVHENLPKFCDNILLFKHASFGTDKKTKENIPIPSRKDEYLNALDYLKDHGRTTQIKNADSNANIEAVPINEKWFEIAKFKECLTQQGIDEYNRTMGHYNLLINLYNQARRKENGFKNLPKFKILFKQIGSARKKAFIQSLEYDTQQQQREANDSETDILHLEGILELNAKAGRKYFGRTEISDTVNIHVLADWLENNEEWEGVYWSKAAVSKISDQYLVNWIAIQDKIQSVFEKGTKEQKDRIKSIATFDKKREEQLKLNDAVELAVFFEILDEYAEEGWSKHFFKESIQEERKGIIDENKTPSENLIRLLCTDIKEQADSFLTLSENILKISEYKKEDNILEIKKWLDTAKSVLRWIKYFEVKPSKVKGNPVNSDLSNMLDAMLHNDDVDWFGWYDLVRNYLSKKPQDDAKKNKLKLNFGSVNLLNGFVDSHSDSDNGTQYGGYLFRKKNGNKYDYYLGISKNAKLFRCHLKGNVQDKSDFERLEYYQAKSTTYFGDQYSELKKKLIETIIKRIEQIVESAPDARKEELNGKAEIVKKGNKNGEITLNKLLKNIETEKEFTHLLNDKSIVKNIEQMIENLKESARRFTVRAPRLQDVIDKKYKGLKGFKQIIEDLQTVAKENKVFDFFNIEEKEFIQAKSDEKKPLYLFKISNKDLDFKATAKNIKGVENLHTLFFRALMREFENAHNIDLGSGAVFYREKAIDIEKDKITVHPANERILRRTDKKIESRFSHTIIKDKRFTESKFHFHLSIALNFNARGFDVNETVNDLFSKQDDIQFLGIDRGEKHLIYYSLVNKDGVILEQGHLDTINNKNYLDAINEVAKIRKEKQENWQQKGNISNLKDGYMSLVVHEIVEKLKDKQGNFKPTFIVLEYLNHGFKTNRQKFEQQVYQKFELALAKKLNYLVDKKAKMGEVGSVAKAVQLTPPVLNYQDIEKRKQVGIMLYTRANYTSVTDPVTGWRKTIYLSQGSEKDIKEKILALFSDFGMDKNDDYFFTYTEEKNGKEWTLWSGKDGKSLERYRGKRTKEKNVFVVESYDVKNLLNNLFKNFDKSKSLKQQIEDGKELQKIDDHTAWETFRFAIDLIQQIRNSGDAKKNQDDNFLLSPVRDVNGEHFDSRKAKDTLPKDADANGAFNIARKGIVMYEHIKEKVKKKQTTDLDLFIKDQEWDLWLTNRGEWEKQKEYFASQKAKLENKEDEHVKKKEQTQKLQKSKRK